MPCLLMHRACKVCGGFHNFFLAEGELSTDERYEYHRPVTGQAEYLWDIISVEAADSPLAGGVEIRPTGHPSGRRTASA